MPDDEMTSFRYDHFVWRLSDFTSDKEQIDKSFRELAQIADRRPEEPEPPAFIAKIERKTPDWLRAIAGLFSIGSNGAPNMSSASPAPRPAPASRTMHTAVFEAATALQNRPRDHRRVIFLISDGVVREPQISLVPGKTLHSFEKNVDLLLKNEIQLYSVYTLADLLESSFGVLEPK